MTDALYKIIGICVLTTLTAITIKTVVPSYFPVLILASGTVCWYVIFPYISELILTLKNIATQYYNLTDYFLITLKIIGISLLCQFSCELCDDMGEKYLSSKIEFAGKLVIVCMCLPEFSELINKIAGMINSL